MQVLLDRMLAFERISDEQHLRSLQEGVYFEGGPARTCAACDRTGAPTRQTGL
jgi:hypothetical protein